MKLTILQESLARGLNIVGRIVPKSLSLPILNNILLSTEKNFLSLITTDLEVGIKWWSLAKVEKEGQTTLPTKIFTNFISLLPNKPIEISTGNGSLELKCQNYQTKIKTLPAEEFPIIPKVSDEKAIFVNSRDFCQSLSQVVEIAQPSSARPEISGVYLKFQKDLVTMVATDSFRLGEKKLSLEKPAQEYSLILPQKAVREIINIFGERGEEIKICFSPNQVLFESPMAETDHPQVQLISRVIEGEYPNYEAIIPKGYKTSVLLEKNEFLNQIKTASLFSGRINEVKLKVDPKKEGIEVSSQNPDLGEYQSLIPGKIKGEKGEVSFNHRFLLDGLLNIKGNDLNLEINGGEGPTAIKPTIDQNYIYIIMPIKAD